MIRLPDPPSTVFRDGRVFASLQGTRIASSGYDFASVFRRSGPDGERDAGAAEERAAGAADESSAGAADDGDGGEVELAVHGSIGPWTLMSVVEHDDHGFIAVFEMLGPTHGALVYVCEAGTIAWFETTAEPTAASASCPAAFSAPPASAGFPMSASAVAAFQRDVLREHVLRGEGDPTWDTVAALIPPIRRIRDGEAERPHTFVGTPESIDVVPVYYDSLRATSRVNPSVVAPDAAAVIREQRLAEGLVGGWLPAVRFVYPLSEREWWESVTFAPPGTGTFFSQPVWYRYLHVVDGRIVEARYIDTYVPYPVGDPPPASAFYGAILRLDDYWKAKLAGGMVLELPEPWIDDFCRHSFVLEMITRTGDHPKYGIVDRIYGAAEHDGFQDTLNASVAAYTEWGHLGVARRYLENYLTEFVRENGTIDYRGPELGQYARMLTAIARYVRLSADTAFIREHRLKLEAIIAILLQRRRRALELSIDRPAHGLITGRHEADISFDTPTLGTMDYEQPYFSNTAEAARGLRDLGRCFETVGRESADESLVAAGRSAQRTSEELRKDLRTAIRRSWIERDGEKELPLIAGATMLHRDAPYRSTPYSYDENRVFGELLHSGMVDGDLIDWVVDSGARRGDTVLGIFGNRKLAVSFTAYGIAYGLLQRDRVREFLLLYYAHAAHLHTRGTWTVVECADLDRDRGEHWPYCAPGQMTIPNLTKWMLVWEDPHTQELWLGKAVPRRWLEDGKRLVVQNAPTAGGEIGLRIESHIEDGEILVELELPERFDLPIVVRLRHPKEAALIGVQAEGAAGAQIDRGKETITLPRGVGPIVRLTARYA